MNKPKIEHILLYFALSISIFFCISPVGKCELVYIDPGHGGSDPGTLTHISGYTEADINMEVGWELKEILENPPGVFTPYLWDFAYTREWDTTISTATRILRATKE